MLRSDQDISSLKLVTDLHDVDGHAPLEVILNSDKLVFGRGSDKNPVDVYINVKKDGKAVISRQHAEIFRLVDGKFLVRDIGALNGVFVNDKRIELHLLSHGDILQFGGVAQVPVGTSLKASDMCLKYRFETVKRLTNNSIATDTTVVNKSNQKSNANGMAIPFKGIIDSDNNKYTIINDNTLEAKITNSINQTKRVSFVTTTDVGCSTSPIRGVDMIIAACQTDKIIYDNNNEITKKRSRSDVNEVDINHKQTHHKSSTTQTNSTDKYYLDTHNDSNITISHPQLHTQSLRKDAATSPSPTLTNPTTTNVAQSSNCVIDASALRTQLNCPICGDILLDAIVLACSHGFCEVCLLKHYTNKNKSSKEKKESSCPVCRGEFVDKEYSSSNSNSNTTHSYNNEKNKSRRDSTSTVTPPPLHGSKRDGWNSKTNGQMTTTADETNFPFPVYYRSEHIDAVVWLLVEASDENTRNKFKARELDHYQYKNNRKHHAFHYSSPAGSMIPTTPMSAVKTPPRCDYCGGDDHDAQDCPHDNDIHRKFYTNSNDVISVFHSEEEDEEEESSVYYSEEDL